MLLSAIFFSSYSLIKSGLSYTNTFGSIGSSMILLLFLLAACFYLVAKRLKYNALYALRNTRIALMAEMQARAEIQAREPWEQKQSLKATMNLISKLDLVEETIRNANAFQAITLLMNASGDRSSVSRIYYGVTFMDTVRAYFFRLPVNEALRVDFTQGAIGLPEIKVNRKSRKKQKRAK